MGSDNWKPYITLVVSGSFIKWLHAKGSKKALVTHTHTHTHTNTHTHKHTYTQTHTHTHTQTHPHTHTRTHKHTLTHTHVHTNTHSHTQVICEPTLWLIEYLYKPKATLEDSHKSGQAAPPAHKWNGVGKGGGHTDIEADEVPDK